jgi:hypothetical protein
MDRSYGVRPAPVGVGPELAQGFLFGRCSKVGLYLGVHRP